MPDYYSEPFLNLAGLTHKSALIAWGAFYFRVKNNESDFNWLTTTTSSMCIHCVTKP